MAGLSPAQWSAVKPRRRVTPACVFDGESAGLQAGRWNNPGTRFV